MYIVILSCYDYLCSTCRRHNLKTTLLQRDSQWLFAISQHNDTRFSNRLLLLLVNRYFTFSFSFNGVERRRKRISQTHGSLEDAEIGRTIRVDKLHSATTLLHDKISSRGPKRTHWRTVVETLLLLTRGMPCHAVSDPNGYKEPGRNLLIRGRAYPRFDSAGVTQAWLIIHCYRR